MLEVNALCWGLLLLLVLAPEALFLNQRIQSGYFRQLHRDFGFFYSLGRIYQESLPAQAYDYDLQKHVIAHLQPDLGPYPPNPYPPFIGILFRPIAAMNYPIALLCWSMVSFLLYIIGTSLLIRQYLPDDPWLGSLIFSFAFSLFPLVLTLNLGHISTIGFFGFALAFRELDRRNSFHCGLCLSICSYKPTLLLLFLPMLFVTRQWKVLAGLVTGGVALSFASTVLEGLSIWPGYFGNLLHFGSGNFIAHDRNVASLGVDAAAVFSILATRSVPGVLALALSIVGAAASLFYAWVVAARRGFADTKLWATTLAWTMVLNVYVPIYDCLTLVILLVVNLAEIRRTAAIPIRTLAGPAAAIALCSWVGPLAASKGVPLLSFAIASVGVAHLFSLFRWTRLNQQTIAA